MSIIIAGYSFSEPHDTASSLESRGGVYAILTPTSSGRYDLLDVGESGSVKERVEGHERTPCWERHANAGGLRYAAHYTPGQTATQRRKIEKAIRREHQPPCGEV